MSSGPRYRRVLVKLSGESLCAEDRGGIDPEELLSIGRLALEVRGLGVELALVVGAGNIIRGRKLAEDGPVRRTTADTMGMLATMMNALALRDAIESLGGEAVILSSFEVHRVCEPFVQPNAVRYLEDGRITIFAGGTGNPFFTTDTAAALRSIEIGAELLVKATKVDGVFEQDPVRNPGARRFDRLSYMDVIRRRLEVMDATAITLCMENRLPIIVLDVKKEGALVRAMRGTSEGTIIEG